MADTKSKTESPSLNPYAAPAAVSDTPVAVAKRVRTAQLSRLLLLQAIVISVSLACEAYEHETIVVSGPVFAMVGLAIAIAAYRDRDRFALIFGVSAIAFALLIVFLINYNSWSPAQGNRPITALSWFYALVALPTSVWLVAYRTESRLGSSG